MSISPVRFDVRKETILNIIPGVDDEHRLVIALEQDADAKSTLVLRQETHSDDVGWFLQSRVVVESDQVASRDTCMYYRVNPLQDVCLTLFEW